MDRAQNNGKQSKVKTKTSKPSKSKSGPKSSQKNGKSGDKTDSKNLSSKKTKAGQTGETASVQLPSKPSLPFLRFKGSRQCPESIEIINKIQMEEESLRMLSQQLRSSTQITDDQNRLKMEKAAVFASAMSENYDAVHRDPSWICVFCQRHSHTDLLGDLYGPYFTEVALEVPQETDCKIGGRRSSMAKRRKSGEVNGLGIKLESREQDIWFHEDCLIWAPGTCFVAPRLLGLDIAISESQKEICNHCGKRGAHIFCRFSGCQQRTHFPCAQTYQWILQEDNFLALCPSHRDLPP